MQITEYLNKRVFLIFLTVMLFFVSGCSKMPEGMLKQELLSETTISMASGLAQYLISQKINVSLISNGVETDGEKTDFLEVEEGGGLSHLN